MYPQYAPSIRLSDLQSVVAQSLKATFDGSVVLVNRWGNYSNRFLTTDALPPLPLPAPQPTADLLDIAVYHENIQPIKRFNVYYELNKIGIKSVQQSHSPIGIYKLSLLFVDTGKRSANKIDIDDSDMTSKMFDILSDNQFDGLTIDSLYQQQTKLHLAQEFDNFYDFHNLDKSKMTTDHRRDKMGWIIQTQIYLTVSVNQCKTLHLQP